MHKVLVQNLCNLHKTDKTCRGGRVRHGERIPLAGAQEERHLQGVGNIHIKWVVIRYSPIAPDFATHSARVSVEGLWIALVHPDIEHKPSEWGRVVVVRPFATNRGRLLAVAKLDGVSDHPNCRSKGRAHSTEIWRLPTCDLPRASPLSLRH